MLAVLGLVTIALLLTVIMTKWMSPLMALILIPIAAALIGGFGWDTSKFIVSGIQSLAPVVGMFVFAILFFGIMTDAGMLDPIIDRILKTVGTRPDPHRDGHDAARAARPSRRIGSGDFPRHHSRRCCRFTSGSASTSASSPARPRWRRASISSRGPGR